MNKLLPKSQLANMTLVQTPATEYNLFYCQAQQTACYETLIREVQCGSRCKMSEFLNFFPSRWLPHTSTHTRSHKLFTYKSNVVPVASNEVSRNVSWIFLFFYYYNYLKGLISARQKVLPCNTTSDDLAAMKWKVTSSPCFTQIFTYQQPRLQSES